MTRVTILLATTFALRWKYTRKSISIIGNDRRAEYIKVQHECSPHFVLRAHFRASIDAKGTLETSEGGDRAAVQVMQKNEEAGQGLRMSCIDVLSRA